jgi:hypothetical protein
MYVMLKGQSMYIHNLNFVFKCVWSMCLDLCGLWISFSVYVNYGLRFRPINFLLQFCDLYVNYVNFG